MIEYLSGVIVKAIKRHEERVFKRGHISTTWVGLLLFAYQRLAQGQAQNRHSINVGSKTMTGQRPVSFSESYPHPSSCEYLPLDQLPICSLNGPFALNPFPLSTSKWRLLLRVPISALFVSMCSSLSDSSHSRDFNTTQRQDQGNMSKTKLGGLRGG